MSITFDNEIIKRLNIVKNFFKTFKIDINLLKADKSSACKGLFYSSLMLRYENKDLISLISQLPKNLSDEDLDLIVNKLRVAIVFGSWSVTKRIYQLDTALQVELAETRLPEIIPKSIFENFPLQSIAVEFACPIETKFSDEDVEKTTLSGVIITKDNSYDTESSEIYSVISFSFITLCGSNDLVKTLVISKEGLNCSELDKLDIYDDILLTKFSLNLALYLCSEKPDVSMLETPTIRRKIKFKSKLLKQGVFNSDYSFAPKITHYSVGALFRKSFDRNQRELPDGVMKLEHSKRPHARRGHWHTFWTGKRGSDEQKAVVKFLVPMLIHGNKR